MSHPLPDLNVLQTRLGGAVAVTRYAPSPTGYLHLGHVVNAVYVWGISRALGGEVILRLEDHDRSRCRPEYEAALLEDIGLLGLNPDRGKIPEFHARTEYRQSDSTHHYTAALDRLRERGLVYACDCSRQSIRARTGQAEAEEIRYDNHCRDRGLPFQTGQTVRVRLPADAVSFHDALAGEQAQCPQAQCGDLAVIDRAGNWTYQFAVVVDDMRQGVNLVIRGRDLLESTGRQLLLAQLLGQNAAPIYLHHGLLTDAAGRKLSKRDFDADIHTLLKEGLAPENLLGKAAHLAGLWPKEEPLPAADLPKCFLDGPAT